MPVVVVGQDLEDLRNLCRTTGHHWVAYDGGPFAQATAWGRANHFVCKQCQTRRHDAVNRFGGLVSRRYEYVDDYRLGRDEERPTADELRLWMMKRNRRLGITS